jgi:hypothetical protein
VLASSGKKERGAPAMHMYRLSAGLWPCGPKVTISEGGSKVGVHTRVVPASGKSLSQSVPSEEHFAAWTHLCTG